MKRIEYIQGQMIGECEFIKDLPNNKNHRMVEVKCKKCGTIFSAYRDNLVGGITKSCGCLKKETTAIIGKTTIGSLLHGDSRTYLYTTWCGIKGRCFNKNRSRYNDWGGRGITMNEQWKNSYPEFKEYVIKNLGERPKGYSIDRINNDGNYEPGNIRWSMPHEQQNNRRKQKLI